MRLFAQISLSIVTLTVLGFCVAYVLEDLWHKRSDLAVALIGEKVKSTESVSPTSEVEEDEVSPDIITVAAEVAFADQIMAKSELEGGLMLAAALPELSVEELEAYFIELIARDWDDYRSLEFAGRILQEISGREPRLGVALLGALTPAEKEELVPSITRGWATRDPDGAFSWIRSAWIEADGGYIDRRLQNQLFASAMDALVADRKDYELAAETLATVVDPELKSELVDLVARRIVRDGPENAMDRLASLESSVFDASIMDAVAAQWAARDGVGAADWVQANESEMTSKGVRSIAKQLLIADEDGTLVGLHQGLAETENRDSVAAEAARLKARRDPESSATWARAIQLPDVKQTAVFDALYEIGYEDFNRSVNYIDFVYPPENRDRAPVVYSTLKDWLAVDLEAVAGYLGSGRANLSADLSEDLLLAMERAPNG